MPTAFIFTSRGRVKLQHPSAYPHNVEEVTGDTVVGTPQTGCQQAARSKNDDIEAQKGSDASKQRK